MTLETFPQLLSQHARERGDSAAMREKEYGIWQTLTWAHLAQLVEQIACGLHQAGLRRGEHMVVLGANRPRLYATMLAAQSLGAIPVPLYQDAAAAECVLLLRRGDAAALAQRRTDWVCAPPARRRHWRSNSQAPAHSCCPSR